MPLSRRPAVGLAFLAFEQLLQPFLEFLQEIASSQIPAPAQFSPPLLQVLAALFAGQLQCPAFQVGRLAKSFWRKPRRLSSSASISCALASALEARLLDLPAPARLRLGIFDALRQSFPERYFSTNANSPAPHSPDLHRHR